MHDTAIAPSCKPLGDVGITVHVVLSALANRGLSTVIATHTVAASVDSTYRLFTIAAIPLVL